MSERTWDRAQLVADMQSMGSTPDEVYLHLAANNCQGWTDCGHCPVANRLYQMGWAEVSITSDGFLQVGVKGPGRSPVLLAYPTEAIAEFINGFDAWDPDTRCYARPDRLERGRLWYASLGILAPAEED
jgi:hypothetical protein